ncbi:MAG: glycosyltransferase [Candidatus Binatia bacterium]
MSPASVPALSILVPTRNRADVLPRLLRTLDAAQAEAQVDLEVVVVDNGSTDGTAAVLDRWAAAAPGRVRMFVEQPGRARALNRALPVARAPLLAFTDDDVEVTPHWIRSLVAFFAVHPEYDAAMGRVRVPPAAADPATLARVAQFPGTLPLFDAGDAVRDVPYMWGCNMAVRRRVIDTVGPYDERLGVGASGLYEDAEFSERIRRAGLRIGYMPDAVVYHSVDPTRLTRQWFREFNVRLARSRYLIDPPQPWRRNLLRFLDAALSCAWWRLLGQRQRSLKAWARMIQHREMLRLRWNDRSIPRRVGHEEAG